MSTSSPENRAGTGPAEEVETELPDTVAAALAKGGVVDQLLMDLQGAPITLLDRSGEGERPRLVRVTPGLTSRFGDGRYHELRSDLGLDPTAPPPPARDSLPPQRFDLAPPPEPRAATPVRPPTATTSPPTLAFEREAPAPPVERDRYVRALLLLVAVSVAAGSVAAAVGVGFLIWSI